MSKWISDRDGGHPETSYPAATKMKIRTKPSAVNARLCAKLRFQKAFWHERIWLLRLVLLLSRLNPVNCTAISIALLCYEFSYHVVIEGDGTITS